MLACTHCTVSKSAVATWRAILHMKATVMSSNGLDGLLLLKVISWRLSDAAGTSKTVDVDA